MIPDSEFWRSINRISWCDNLITMNAGNRASFSVGRFSLKWNQKASRWGTTSSDNRRRISSAALGWKGKPKIPRATRWVIPLANGTMNSWNSAKWIGFLSKTLSFTTFKTSLSKYCKFELWPRASINWYRGKMSKLSQCCHSNLQKKNRIKIEWKRRSL